MTSKVCLFQTLGNHEFDNGVSGLIPFIQNITAPVVCANLNLAKVPQLAKETNLMNSLVIDVDGRKIGIVGYLTPNTKIEAKANDVEYIDEIVALRKEVKNLQGQKINIIIALGHSGYSRDIEIAREVDGLDLVIGGHSNTFLWNGTAPDSDDVTGPYPKYVSQASGKTVLVVQTYAYTKYLGKLLLTFNSNGDIVGAQGSPIILNDKIPQDRDVLSIVKRYSESTASTASENIGITSVVLEGLSCKLQECNLGNLITDAIVYYYAAHYKGDHWTDAPIAFMNAGGIRNSIAHINLPTNVTTGDLSGVMPFDDNLTTITINGSLLLQVLETSVQSYEKPESLGILQMSGLKVVFNMNRPVGSRVVKAEAVCWACDVPRYFPVEEKELYKIILPNFLARGGDGYSMLASSELHPLDYNEKNCTWFYMKEHHLVYPRIEGRVTILKAQYNSSSTVSLSVAVLLTYFSFFIHVL